MSPVARRRPARTPALVAATVLCYAVGYPVALWGHSPVGWLFVTLGGVLLFALAAVVVRRVHLGSQDGRRGGAIVATDVEPPPASGTTLEDGHHLDAE